MFGHILYLKDIEKPDYSNFDRKSWKQRNRDDHSKWNKIYIKCKPRKEQEEVECASEICYSLLSELPYFNCSI